MKLKKLVILLATLIFLLAFSTLTTSQEENCLCGVHKIPSDYPLNYHLIKGVSSENPEECDVWCYDETGALREECYENGSYSTFILCEQTDYCNLVVTLSNRNAMDAHNCTYFCPPGISCPVEINFDKDWKACSYRMNQNDQNIPKVYADNADAGNGCCGDDIIADIGFRAENNKFICVDDSEDFPGQYQWLHAGELGKQFKIVPINLITEEGEVSYDVVSNAEQWFICDPGVEIIGPDITVDILKPNEGPPGYQPLVAGVVYETLEGLGVDTYTTIPTFIQTQTPGEVVEFSTFGLDFERVEPENVSEFDTDGDGFIALEYGGTDCNDLDPTTYPGAFDPCGDNVDQDCDGFIEFPDGIFCQPISVTLNIPDVASRFMCYNEDKRGSFAECCGYDLNKCYNQVPKGRRQGAVLTTIEEFQEGCAANKNCVQKFGLVSGWGGDYYSFDIPINKTDSRISNWIDYATFEFFIYLSDDYVMDVMVLGSHYQGDGTKLDDYTLLFYQPITDYVVNSPELGKWMHVVIPIDDDRWILPPEEVTHILLYAPTNKVIIAGGKTKATIAEQTKEWENVIGVDRLFLRPKQGTKFCSGTNLPTWINDLDDSTLVEGQEQGKEACQETPTFGWTGSKCCGDDTNLQNKEYFADSFAGCWNGEVIPSDQTTINIEYEISYNIPTYDIQEQSRIEYPEFTFDVEVSGKKINLEEEVIFEDYDIEITKQESPKLIADLSTGAPEKPFVDLDEIIDLNPSSEGDYMCPENYVACGVFGEYGDDCQPFWWWPHHLKGMGCCHTTLPIDYSDPVYIPMSQTCPGIFGEGLCPAGYVVCGFRQGEISSGCLTFVRRNYFIQSFYCCPVSGMIIENIRTVEPVTRGEIFNSAEPREILCGFCGLSSRWMWGEKVTKDWARKVNYCRINDPTKPAILTLKITPEDPRLNAYFETSNDLITKNITDKVYAEFDQEKQIVGYGVTPIGKRKITKTITASCKSDKCIYPLPGLPPYTLKNLHPQEYDLMLDTEKGLIIAERVPQRIKFYNGSFYSCLAPDYLFDYGVDINGSPGACEVIGSHFCSPDQGWNNKAEGAPNASSRDTAKSTPGGYPIQSTSCCPANYCWNSTACVPSEANVTALVNPLILGDNVWRCLDGNWTLSIRRYAWDFSQSGFCPTITQCLVDPAGNASLNNQPETYDPTIDIPQCIETRQFIEDHYCFNGTWTSRTKLIALQLLDIVNKTGDEFNYTLFCDNYKNALAVYDYLSIEDYLRGKLFAMPPISIYTCSDNMNYVMPCVNNFCVLKYTDRSSGEQKVVFGTSLNKPINDSEFSFLRTLDQKSDYCSDLIGTGSNFTKCSNDPNIWYSDAINSVIFSKTGILIGPLSIFDSFVRFLFNPIRSIINYVVDTIAPRAEPSGAVIDYNFTKNVKDFNQIYINSLYGISIRAIIEQPQLDKKFITIKYFGVPEDVCLAVDVYDRANPPPGQISCTKEDSVYYVISDQEVAFKVWTDFTSKLRPVYSP